MPADRARNRDRSRGREGDMGSSKRKRKSLSKSNMSGTGDPSANLYSLNEKRIKTGFGSGNSNASSTLGPETGNPRGSPEILESYLSETRFDRLALSPMLLNGVKDLGYEKMTLVQEATLPAILQGKDVLAKATTGMGKTLAFLLPSIHIVSKLPRTSPDYKQSSAINVLVICPNRELVNQVASEANNLLKYNPFIGVQVLIGGKSVATEEKNLRKNRCEIIVATPGRLWDHIENTRGFEGRLRDVSVLILHEADSLLATDQKDVEKIIAAVPEQRQTLIFSATVPEEVHQFCHIALRKDHEFIDIVQESSAETHSQAQQMHLIAPLDKYFSLLYILLQEHIANDVDYKAIVFCTTIVVTRLVAEFLCKLNMNVREIHSRKTTGQSAKVSDEFRKSKGLILVTSNLPGGVNYPDVTLVIQVGAPASRAQYLNRLSGTRLGGTGRDGKKAQGVLLLSPWEDIFLSSIKDLPMAEAPLPLVDPDINRKVEEALSDIDKKTKESAYMAWLHHYNCIKEVSEDKHRLVELANDLSRSMGLDNLPEIPTRILNEMGLTNIPDLRAT